MDIGLAQNSFFFLSLSGTNLSEIHQRKRHVKETNFVEKNVKVRLFWFERNIHRVNGSKNGSQRYRSFLIFLRVRWDLIHTTVAYCSLFFSLVWPNVNHYVINL